MSHNNKGIKKKDKLLKDLEKFTNLKNETFVDQSKSKNIRPKSSLLVINSQPFSKIKRAINLSSHVGFGFSNRDMIFLENNNIENSRILTNLKPFLSKNSTDYNIFGDSNMF